MLFFKHISLPLCYILYSRVLHQHCKCVTKWRPWAFWHPNQPSAMRTLCVTAGSSFSLSLVWRVWKDTFFSSWCWYCNHAWIQHFISIVPRTVKFIQDLGVGCGLRRTRLPPGAVSCRGRRWYVVSHMLAWATETHTIKTKNRRTVYGYPNIDTIGLTSDCFPLSSIQDVKLFQ